MKSFSKEVKKAMQSELEDIMKLKEDLILEKAKLTALKGSYEIALKHNDLNKQNKRIDKSIDNQESLNKFEDFQIAQLIEQNSQHIWDIINADENLDFTKHNDHSKTIKNDKSFTGKNVYFEDTSKKRNKRKHKQNTNINDSKLEYCLEEDDLSYNSSLH